MSQAVCCFCSRHESSVIVICESRCLLCNRCQNSVPIKKLLVDYFHKVGVYNAGYDSYASNASFLDINSNVEERKIGCPICSQPLAPQMIQSIKLIIDQLEKTNSSPLYDETGRLFGDLDFKELSNPFIAFIKRYRQTYNDQSAMIAGETDGNNDIVAPPIVKNTEKNKENNQQQLLLAIGKERKAIAAAIEIILDCYCNLWLLLLKNETESMTETAMKMCSRKKLSSKTNDLKAKSIVDFFSSPGGSSNAQLFLFGKLLGLLPKRSNFIRQSWGPIAVIITVLAYCDKCLKRGALIVKDCTPSTQEFRSKLGKAPGSKIISITKAFNIIKFLINTNQPHWCISPMSSICIENNIPLPWSSDSQSRLLHLIFYSLGFDEVSPTNDDSNVNVFTTELSSPPGSPIPKGGARKSIFQNKNKPDDKIPSEIPMTRIQTLPSKAHQIWHGQLSKVDDNSGFASLALGKVTNDKITKVSFEQASAYASGITISVAELALICIIAWETEYLFLEEYSSRAVIRRERRPAIAGTYISTQTNIIPAEKLAISRIMNFYEKKGLGGVDWQEVYDNFQLEIKIFPFRIPDSLRTKSQAELNFLANLLKFEKEKQTLIERKEDLLAADGPYSKVLLKKSHAKLAGLDSVTYATVLNKIVNKKDYNQAYDVIGLSRDEREALSRGQFIATQGLQGTDPFPEIDEELKVLSLSTYPVRAAYPLPANLDPSLPLELMARTLTPHRLAPIETSFTYQDVDGLEYLQSEYIDLEDDETFKPSVSAEDDILNQGSITSYDGPNTDFDEEGRLKIENKVHLTEEVEKFTEDVLLVASAANLIELTEDAEHDRSLYTTTALYTSKGLETDHVIPKTPLIESRPASRGVALSKQPYSGSNPGRHAVNLVDVLTQRNYNVLSEVGMLENISEPVDDNTIDDFSLLSSPSRLNVLSAARNRVRKKALINASEYEASFLNESIATKTVELASLPTIGDGSDTVRGLGKNQCGPNGENGGIIMNLNINNYIDKNENTMESKRSAEIIVESLSLTHTNVTKEGFASAMFRYLSENQLLKIRKIDFSNNKLSYQSGAAFANQLRYACRLVHLKLDNNLFGDNGIGKILDAIFESGGAAGLVRLELKNNNITFGTNSLESLQHFRNIKALDLGNNCITVDTKRQKLLFLNIFKNLVNLEFLSLRNNKIKDDGFFILMNEILNRNNVKRLDLSNCFITSKSIKLIQSIVTKECTHHNYDYLILHGHIINSELLHEIRYMINANSINIFFEGDHGNIDYPLLYSILSEDLTSASIEKNDKKNDTSEKINSKLMTPMTPLDYYRYEDMKSREEAKQKEVADKRNEENNEG